MRQLLLSILFLLYAQSFACSCAPVKLSERIKFRNRNIQTSEEVFIADVFAIDTINYTYKLKVKEVFKGAFVKGEVIKGSFLSTCEPYVSIEGTWLLFGDFSDDEFRSKDCGYSKSFEFPWYNALLAPKPDPEGLFGEELVEFQEKEWCNFQNIATINLSEDIEYLRSIKATLGSGNVRD
ncbi:hypothetical protein [Owenweeksia hongkongensis]|uniref:hypothetical protein n=1 Tax=Owenweeksia hongkongensis TaxID=253245 RepID=UPI003A908A6B